MTAIEQALVEQIQKLTVNQQREVLEFARHLSSQNIAEENQNWTDEELQELTQSRRKTTKEVIAWLDAHPPAEEWGSMKPDDDPAEFIHNQRRQSSNVLADPGELE